MDEIFEGYPELNDSELLNKLYRKREFYYNKINKRDILEQYEDIQKYREENCKITKEPKEFQLIVPNLISPSSPYNGLILMYGVGIGKTMTAIRTTEQFKSQVKKYNTKIYILVSGPNSKENFKKELIESTNKIYYNNVNLNNLSKKEKEYETRVAINNAMEYYKIISYKSLYKRVLGEKIIEKKLVDGKMKNVYKKTKSGDYERELSNNRITNMDNTIIVIDEAHNIVDNEYGEALKKVINNSINLKILLLTATPMINYADEIVTLINYIRPKNDKISRDKIFTNDKNYLMDIKKDGIEYLQKMAKGYISYMRGAIPYTFAERINMGEIPKELLFTPVIKCYMENFQYTNYMKIFSKIKLDSDEIINDKSINNNFSLTISASNFIFPSLDKNNKLIGISSNDGINNIIEQIDTNNNLINAINTEIFHNKIPKENIKKLLYVSGKRLTGYIFKKNYLKFFSSKFFKIINNLENLTNDNCGTAFIYSNLVKAGGIELFSEVLIQNGYLEYNENNDYNINDDTLDYKTGLPYIEYIQKYSPDQFNPSIFLLIIGSNDQNTVTSEQNQNIISQIFNNKNNIDGKQIKFVLGSKVMNEAITLKNCKEVHIIDAFFNISRIEQVIGRVVRMCVHMDVTNDNNKFPQVKIYKYVASIGDKNHDKLSSDELLYQKAEYKYITIKQIEKKLKEISIDCPLLINGNVFPEDIKKYENCIPIKNIQNMQNDKIDKSNFCPALCDFDKCEYKCNENTLNKLWDYKNKTYKNLPVSELDFSTFTEDKYANEINTIKNKIKELYRYKYVYTYDELYNILICDYSDFHKELFDKYFLNIAIEMLLPKNENEFNNFTDIIYDKYNKEGYLINRGIYFIFQSNDQNEQINMYYRKMPTIPTNHNISLKSYLNNIKNNNNKNNIDTLEKIEYNFIDVIDYYNNKKENKYVGIISYNDNKMAYDSVDLFKIRKSQNLSTDKKRGTGIPTFLGGVCSTSKNKKELLDILENIPGINKHDIKKIIDNSKNDICEFIKNKLLELEKYSTDKITYMIIPKNHPKYVFPYNLEDRIEYIKTEIKKTQSFAKIKVSKKDKLYTITIPKKNMRTLPKSLDVYNFKLVNDLWTCEIL